MIIFKTIFALQQHLQRARKANKKVGFVPTMGALHQGHIALIQHAQTICDVMVTSIFVNPAQFNDPKDFEKYPVTIEQDCLKLEEQQTDILFLPSVEEIYPAGPETKTHFEMGTLETVLEGYYRPGHFQGVCQVVKRLLEIVQPYQLFLGQKDYQQCKVIQRLIELTGSQTEISIIPTVREKDGLAMSSRNIRLSPKERKSAVAIYQQLNLIKENLGKYSLQGITEQVTSALLKAGFSKVDYVSIADAEILQPVTEISEKQKKVALIAAFMGEVRLIDNMLLS